MSTVERLSPMSIEEYLEREQRAEVRHEYVGGYVYAMVGGSRRHNLIALTLYRRLFEQVPPSCRVYVSDLKVQVDDRFYYPDVVVACGDEPLAEGIERAPSLVVEVLSPTTEARDRMEKRLAYQSLESLREYVLVAQDRIALEVFRRADDGWTLERLGEGDELRLESVACALPVDEIYSDVLDAS